MRYVAAFSENHLIKCLLQAVSDTGVQTNPTDTINLYVSLKSKPLAIVTGPTGHGKRLVAEVVARILAGDNPFRLQVISGHPQWTTNTGRVVFFTEAQSRLMTAKIEILVEEALIPSNKDHLFIICLTGISPAELYSIFVEIADHYQRKNRKHASDLPVFQLAPFPTNLLIIGTMDTTNFDWLNPNHYSQIGLVDWSECEERYSGAIETVQPMPTLEHKFLQTRVIDVGVAQRKLDNILGDSHDVLHSIQCIRDILSNYAIQLPQSVDHEVIVYLANAWSTDQIGLFKPSHLENLAIATDLAIAQTILPRIRNEIVGFDELQNQLLEVVVNYPRSSNCLEHLRKGIVNNRQSSKDSVIIDPVCGMALKPSRDILQSQYQGRIYYFCSHNCKNAFDRASEKFIHGKTED